MVQDLPNDWFVIDTQLNAAVTLLGAGLLGATAIVYLLVGRFVWATVTAIVAVIVIVPPVVARSWTYTLPWPLLATASFPLVLGSFQPAFFSQFVVSIGVAALGMLIVSALQLTTTVRMTPPFAVVFVGIATLAVVGFWAVGSAFSAAHLGGTFVETNDELMQIFSVALVAGLVSGFVFWLYFRWQLRRTSTPPPQEVESP
ncbi:hypothetical protein [Natrinema ejinorense]|uniref:Uncharacterized protein n=1 Tax=Natrinema ejinorense TaxID=373386 RepID=A0A2A5QU61_9EURY|nr:hypothetical protein [Natrinema ejinorense]PCR90377.1 hypothetical protein CP557_07390 [Natrinema ejinorense]